MKQNTYFYPKITDKVVKTALFESGGQFEEKGVWRNLQNSNQFRTPR